jgi:chromosome segregation ATPase
MEELKVEITLKYNYGKLKAGNTYDINDLLDEIDRLNDEITELKEDKEKMQEHINQLEDKPVNPYTLYGLNERDFH